MADDEIPQRVTALLSEPPYITLLDQAMERPCYHKETCPNGLVGLERADNMLSEDILCKKINLNNSNVKMVISKFTPNAEGESLLGWIDMGFQVIECYPGPGDTESLYYNVVYGSERLRDAMAKFLTRYMKAKEPLDPEKIIVTAGIAGALHHIAMATANIGDYYLIPSPCYVRIGPDMRDGAGILPIYVPMLQNGFSDALNEAFNMATKEGKKVRGVVISNPDNPTGRVYTKEEVMDVLEMCARNKLHAVMDEAYALSVFGDAEFDSVLSYPNLPDPQRTHFLWSLSKDLCLSGYRIGVIYTENDLVIQYVRKLSLLSQVAMPAQITIANFLSDYEWFDNVYFPTNLKLLKDKFNSVRKRMEDLGLSVYPSQAGFYLWVNFSKFMKENTFEAERELNNHIFDAGVLLASGECFFSPEPGWFRIVFSLQEDLTNEGLSRLERFLVNMR